MLIKSPESPNSCVQPLQYFSAARVAFRTILENLDFSKNKKLLLPAYIGITDREGSGVSDPVQQTATAYEFYTLDKKLQALKNDLYDQLRSENYSALLIIHYFGFCQNNMAEIIELCHQHNIVLIEDCAHSMLSDSPYGQLGKLGDFSFYSIHKFLAVKDGGCLRVNNRDYEHMLQKPPRIRPALETLDMLARVDLEVISEKRRSNYLYLLKLIRDCQGIDIIYPELPNGIVPHNLPITVKGGQRQSVYFKLIDDGVPVVALYYRMIKPIIDKCFGDSLYLSENILNLPVHQDIQEDDLEFIAQKLKESLKA